MARELVYAPQAIADLDEIYAFIADDSPDRAERFIADIRRRCRHLIETPELGVARPDLGAEIRIYPMRRRIVVAYCFTDRTVDVLRVFYAGRDFEALLGSGE
jgi:toxin ParE1/3/4